jgi:hypothetical protein
MVPNVDEPPPPPVGPPPPPASGPPVGPPAAASVPGLYRPPEHVTGGEPLPVLVSFPVRAKQRRWTVLIRVILAFPLTLVVLLLGIGAFFVIIIGWFGALFTGRLPQFARRYIVRYLKFTVNLYAYLYLLTDIFPPFEADVPEFPAHMAVPTATKLNRWAVFFRVILVIPASIVSAVVGYGVGVLTLFLWLITLCSAWLPLSAHNALAAFIRYQTRVGAYLYLVVPTYPNGLFGDGVAPTVPESTTAQVAVPPLAEATAPLRTPETMLPAIDVLDARGTPAAAPALQGSWKLLLNRGARRLLVITIILGALVYVGQITLQVGLASHDVNEVNTLNSSVATLNSAFLQYEQNVKDCPTGGTRVACVEGAAATLSSQLRTFADRISGLSVNGLPPNAIASAASSARTNAGIFEQLANAGPSVADYLQVAQSVGLKSHLDQLQSDLNAI